MREALGVEAKLIAGGGGIFDVIVDDKKVFSKDDAARFPDPGEIANKLQRLA